MSITKAILIVIPFVIYPYLIRNFGPATYGKYVYCMAILAFAQVIINYGFDLSGTKIIAENIDSLNEKSRVFFNVFYLKIALSFVVFILFICLYIILELEVPLLLYLLCFVNIFLDCLYPTYFFTGIEKQVQSLKIQITSKIIFIIFIFSLIDHNSNIYFIPFLGAITSFIGLIISFYFLIKNEISPKGIEIDLIISLFKGGGICFLSRVFSVINSKIGMVFLGAGVSSTALSYFDLSQKLIDLARVPIDIINQIIFPKMVINKDIKLVVITSVVFFIYGIAFVVGVYLFGEYAVLLLGGEQLIGATEYLVLLSWLVPLSALSWVLGNNILIAFGYDRYFLFSSISSTIFFLIYCVNFKLLGQISVEVICDGMLLSAAWLFFTRLLLSFLVLRFKV
nr:oligosaccharide flippase family protein [Vibrio splendidus]